MPLQRVRVSIAGLMALVAILALGMTALRYPTPLWGNALFSGMVALLTVVLIGVIFARGRIRVFCAGALIAGALSFLLHFVPWFHNQFGNFLISAAAADLLYERFAAPEKEEEDDADGATAMDQTISPRLQIVDSGDTRSFRVVLAGGFGGDPFGGGVGKVVTPPTATESWTSVERPSSFPFGTASRTVGVGGINVMRPAPPAMRRIVNCLTVILWAIVGGFVARGFSALAREDAEPERLRAG